MAQSLVTGVTGAILGESTTSWLPFEIHLDTPPEGAPKPFSPEEWPRVRARLERLAQEVGLPIDRRDVT